MFKGSRSKFQTSNIVAIVMEWDFKTHQAHQDPPACPGGKVKELVRFLLMIQYVPFSWGTEIKTIVKDSSSKHHKEVSAGNLIWLHRPSLPEALALNATLSFKDQIVTRVNVV